MDKKDDRPRGKSPDRDRRRSEARHETNRMDPHSVRCRIFIGNLATEKISRQELEDIFSKYGHIDGCSLHNNYGFVQYESEKAADEAVAKEDGRMILGKKLDVHLVSDKRRKGPPEPVRGGRGGRGGRDRPSPSRDRGRMDDFGGRYPSRFDHPEPEHYGRPLSPPRRGGFREPFDRPDDYHRDRYRDDPMRDPYDRRDLPPPRRPYDERRDPYDYPPRGEPRGEMRGDLRGDPRDPYYDRDVRRDDLRRDDFRHEGPPRGDPRRDDIRRDEPRRDEPYGRYDSYGRDYPDDYGPPLKKSRPESDSIYNKSIQAPTDCVVIVVNKILIDYGKMVERQFKDSGLVTDLQMLGMRSMAEVLDNITRHGVLYAVVVTSQHEVHRSVTVNILHGTPQEHRNMPLEDALSLVSRNFDQYMQDLRKRAGDLDKNKEKDYEKEREREKERPKEQDREREREREKSSRSSHEAPTVSKAAPHDDDMKKLLGKAASGGQLSSDELSKLIADLSKQKKQSEIQAGQGSSGGPSAPSQTQPPPTDTSSIAKQQADLQAKIFSILNPSTLSKVSLSVAQSASGAPPSSVAPAKTSGLSNPLFPAAKALAGSTSSGYNSQSTMSASAGPAGKMAYGSSAAANLSTKPTPSGSFGVPKAQAPASSSYGVPKAAVSTPSWYSGSQPATTQQTSPSFRNKPQPSTPSSTSYGVPKQSPTSFGVPKQSPTSYGVPKASPTNFGAPNSSSSFGGANSATSYGVPKASPPVQAPPRRGGFQQSGPSPSAGPPGRGANSNRGIMGAVPGRGMARGGPPPGVTAVRGAPPNIRGASANRGGLYHSRGPAPRGPSPGGMPGMGHPIRGGVPGGPRYGVPSFRPPTPQGAPISTVSGRGRQPPRY